MNRKVLPSIILLSVCASPERKVKIAIIGTGPAGSYAAYLAKKQGHSVEVFEKNTEIGGRTLSHRQDGFTHDTGAAFITNFYNRVFECAPELGLEEKLHGILCSFSVLVNCGQSQVSDLGCQKLLETIAF